MSQFKSHRVYTSGSVKVAAIGGGQNGTTTQMTGTAQQVRSQSNINDQAGSSNMNVSSPQYLRQLPQYKSPYMHLIEMYNKKTCKRRVIKIRCVNSVFRSLLWTASRRRTTL